MSLGGDALDAENEKKRFSMKVTLVGDKGCGKTSIVSQFVNNIFPERHLVTENCTLYHSALSIAQNEDQQDGPKFNVLLEIEDTPCITMFSQTHDIFNMYSFWWPRTEAEACAKPKKKDKKDKDKDVNLPFSMLHAPVAKHNDKSETIERCVSGIRAGMHFCLAKDTDSRFRDKQCHPETEQGNLGEKDRGLGHQCMSCKRFDSSLSCAGEYRPMVRQRMAWLFVFDATKQKAYVETLKRLKEFRDYHRMQLSTRKPVVYLVGNRQDESGLPGSDFHAIEGHLKDVIKSGEYGRVRHQFVSALQYKNIQKLFREVIQEIRRDETLWKFHSLDAVDEADGEDKGGCEIA